MYNFEGIPNCNKHISLFLDSGAVHKLFNEISAEKTLE
jgi:hypothetical protein